MAVNFALIKFDGLSLLLPQTEVGLIEVSNNIDEEQTSENSIGLLKSGVNSWPVFALGADFLPSPSRPQSYKFCLCLNLDGEAAFAIACEEVSTLSLEQDKDLMLVPTCMRIPGCPIEFLTFRDNNMMLVSHTETMNKFLAPETTIE